MLVVPGQRVRNQFAAAPLVVTTLRKCVSLRRSLLLAASVLLMLLAMTPVAFASVSVCAAESSRVDQSPEPTIYRRVSLRPGVGAGSALKERKERADGAADLH